MKKYVFLLITLLWMGIIFYFSNQEASKSSDMSNSFLDNTVINIHKVFDSDLSQKEITSIQDFWFVPIRKLAHFFVYFILGILVFFTLKEFDVKNDICYYAIFICFLYAISDEFHQLFVSGRSGEMFDIFLDTAGSSISIFMVWYIHIKSKFKFN